VAGLVLVLIIASARERESECWVESWWEVFWGKFGEVEAGWELIEVIARLCWGIEGSRSMNLNELV